MRLTSLSPATIARLRRADRDLDQRYSQLLDQARELQGQAGFANANLRRGLTTNRAAGQSD
jgi:hypothetical protein